MSYSEWSENCAIAALTKSLTAWILRFTHNCTSDRSRLSGPLSTAELGKPEQQLWRQSQSEHFSAELYALQKRKCLSKGSCLQALHPIIDQSGLLRVGGRVHNSDFAYSQRHPVILHGQHQLTRLIIQAEHIRFLHAGPTFIS